MIHEEALGCGKKRINSTLIDMFYLLVPPIFRFHLYSGVI